MENEILAKLERLKIYLPFIDYLLQLDKVKYHKLVDIKKWIVTKKRYPKHVLEKVEQSIRTQYKNLFLVDDVKVPKEIMQIFNNTLGEVKYTTVDLCSDEDEDDDVEIISSTLPEQPVKKSNSVSLDKMPLESRPCMPKSEEDEETAEFLRSIDQMVASPKVSDGDEEQLFTRRDDEKKHLDTHHISSKLKTVCPEVVSNDKLVDNRKSPASNTAPDTDALLTKPAEMPVINDKQSSEPATISNPIEKATSLQDMENMDESQLNELIKSIAKNNYIDLDSLLASFSSGNTDTEETEPNSSNNQTDCLSDNTTVSDSIPSANQPQIVYNDVQQQPHKNRLANPMPQQYQNATCYPPEAFAQPSPPPARQNSPHYSYKDRETAANLNYIGQQSARNKPIRTTPQQPTTYGEHKRQEAEKKRLEAERKERAVEREAREKKEKMEAERYKREKIEFELKQKQKEKEERQEKEKIEIEQREKQKAKLEAERIERENQAHTDEIRQILMSELGPYGDQIGSMLRKPTTQEDNYEGANDQDPIDSQKGKRELKRLNCTVNGYNKMSDYVTNTIGGKRRSSMCARSEIAKQLNTSSANESSQEMPVVNMVEIPCENLTSDEDQLASNKIAVRRKSIINDNQSKKVRKRSSSSAANIRYETADTDTDDDFSDFKKFQLEKQKLLALKYQPFVKLTRLAEAELAKYHLRRRTRTTTETSDIQNNEKIFNGELVVTEMKTSNKQSKSSATNTTVKPAQKLKHANTDEHMTERNTKLCKLCKSKPADLTNHYIRSHKTESYTSRLTDAELVDLQSNIPFGVAMAKSGNANVTKYKVKCPFCDEDIISNFNDLHWHYSTHTGEYAFQCSGCKMQKPFRVDILSHQNHSKLCRNGRVQNLYLYPANPVIYLHSCTICHFVQLNEANVFKHLRDHHDQRSDDKEYVQKYTLAAIIDDESDDGIIVSNEPIHEDSFSEEKPRVEELMKDLFSTPTRDDSFEMAASRPNAITPGTGIMCRDNSMAPMGIVSVQLHVPMQLQESEDIKPDVSELQFQINTLAAECEPNEVNMQEFEKQEELLECGPPRTLQTTNTQICAAVVPLISPTETPLTQPLHHRNAPNKHYREFPKNTPYFGLFKCMATDCFYSTDADDEILQHLKDHIDSECPPQGVLDCAYCQPGEEQYTIAENLIAHLRKSHFDNRFQCTSCCYRSCVPGNVTIHQQQAHPESEDDLCDLVYECEGRSVELNDRLPQMKTALLENVKKHTCTYCSTGFFSNRFMEEHLRSHHQILNIDPNTFQRYACIYCSLNLSRRREVQEHIAAEHPDELAFACERVLRPGLEVDSVHNIELIDISLTVSPENIKSTLSAGKESDAHVLEKEAKPTPEQILRINVETLKPLLVKLTSNTGVSPDRLYHCPVPSCGGFFSIYMLWSRHMTSRHKCLLCTCPHCPEDINLPLPDFERHFEHHCRHLFLCFHCGESTVNEQQLRQHAADKHPASLEVRLEKIPFNISYSYTILIDKDLHTDRLKFLLELKEVLRKRLKQMEEEESNKFTPKWKISQSDPWLEEFPNYNIQKSTLKKCFINECLYRSQDEVELFEHLNAHPVSNHFFKCSKCFYERSISGNWDVVVEHVKMHNSHKLHICSVCRYYHYDRLKLTDHIIAMHNTRDVPIVSLYRTEHTICLALSVIFAASRKTFSTMSSCICCIQGNLGPETFAMHLKKSHKLQLRYFCELCNDHLPQLQQSQEHFTSKHSTESLKICCQLASRTQVSVIRAQPLQVLIEGDKLWARKKRTSRPDVNGQPSGKNPKIDNTMTIKEEKDDEDSDDCVMIIEDDDLAILEESKACRIEQETAPQPQKKLQCVNIKNLLQSPQKNIPVIPENPDVSSSISPSRVTIKLPMKISELQTDTFLNGCQGTMECANSNNAASKQTSISIKYITKPTSTQTILGTTSAQGYGAGAPISTLEFGTARQTQAGLPLLQQQFGNPINTLNTPNYGLGATSNNHQPIPQPQQQQQQQYRLPAQQSPASTLTNHQLPPRLQSGLELRQHSPTSYSVNFTTNQTPSSYLPQQQHPIVLRQQLPASTSVRLISNANERKSLLRPQLRKPAPRQQIPATSTVNFAQTPTQGQRQFPRPS